MVIAHVVNDADPLAIQRGRRQKYPLHSRHVHHHRLSVSAFSRWRGYTMIVAAFRTCRFLLGGAGSRCHMLELSNWILSRRGLYELGYFLLYFSLTKWGNPTLINQPVQLTAILTLEIRRTRFLRIETYSKSIFGQVHKFNKWLIIP